MGTGLKWFGYLILFLAIFSLPQPCQAVDYQWNTGNGVWNVDTNWNPVGEPGEGDIAYVTKDTATDLTVTYDTYLAGFKLEEVHVNATGGGTMILAHTSFDKSLFARYEFVGIAAGGKGTINHSIGANLVDALILGTYDGSLGTYNLSGSGYLRTSVYAYIGGYGTGVFNQIGGTHEAPGGIYVGSYNGSHGTYDHSGGNVDAPGSLYVGYQSGTQGTYILDGTADLSAPTAYIGFEGTGQFTQEGGTSNITGNLHLGQVSTGDGTYELNNGSLTVGSNLHVGFEGSGTFTQNGGNLSTYTLTLGSSSGGSGTYNLYGGTITAENINLDYANGVFNQTGGSWQGVFNQDGGTVMGTLENLSTSTFNYYGGAFLGRLLNRGTVNFHADFTAQNGLEHHSDLTLGPGLTVTLNGQGLVNFGTFTLAGATLTGNNLVNDPAGTFNFNSGLLDGNFLNEGMFTYTGGTFDGRLVNFGSVDLNHDFTAVEGIQNITNFTVPQGLTVTLQGDGSENLGTFMLNGGSLVIDSGEPLLNNGFMTGHGYIYGDGVLVNNNFFAQSGGPLVLGETYNMGNFTLDPGYPLGLGGGNFNNGGTLNLNNSSISGPGALFNTSGGTISGKGLILSPFANNGGVLVVAGGTTNIDPAFANSGLIQLTGYTANLVGGEITNSGNIEGMGHIGNAIINTGFIEALGGTLTLGDTVSNQSGGHLLAGSGSRLLMAAGLLGSNEGIINLTGGAFQNNDQVLENQGQITGWGNLRTIGLTNTGTGTITLTGGTTTVNGDLTNQADGILEIRFDPAIFTGNVVNNEDGIIKVTETTVTWAGGFVNNGIYDSDPSLNKFTDLTVGATGAVLGDPGDDFEISGNFENSSSQNEMWNTSQSELAFTNGGAAGHDLYINGVDRGPTMAGYEDNFAWGTLRLCELREDGTVIEGTEQTVHLVDGNDTPGGALYVNEILGADCDFENLSVLNILGAPGLNLYYNPLLDGNEYLQGLTFALNEARTSSLAPTPLPDSVLLLGSGLLGLGLVGWRRKRCL